MNITKFGFEQEYFFTKNNSFELLTDYELTSYLDHCGYLVEARGEAHKDPYSAMKLHEVAQHRLKDKMTKYGYAIHKENTMDVPKEHQRICLRKFGKNPAQAYFMAGRVYTSNRPRAGLHIHFGSTETITWTAKSGEGFSREYCPMFNFSRIVYLMDRAFKDEIKAAKRIPGEYELKPHGFEYRSLPTTVDLLKVVNVCYDIMKD